MPAAGFAGLAVRAFGTISNFLNGFGAFIDYDTTTGDARVGATTSGASSTGVRVVTQNGGVKVDAARFAPNGQVTLPSGIINQAGGIDTNGPLTNQSGAGSTNRFRFGVNGLIRLRDLGLGSVLIDASLADESGYGIMTIAADKIFFGGTLAGGIVFGNTDPGGSGLVRLSGRITCPGMEFPVSQVASADPNTFDDYEEGTWTAGITFGGGSTGLTFSTRQASYTKLGNVVNARCFLALSAKGSSTGAVAVTGLPFTSSAVTGQYTPISVHMGGAYTSAPGALQGYLPPSSTSLVVDVLGAAALASLTDAHLANTTDFMIEITYTV